MLTCFCSSPEAVPHGGHDFGDLPEGGAGVLALDGRLGVPEEEGVGRDGLLRFVGVLLLPPLLGCPAPAPATLTMVGFPPPLRTTALPITMVGGAEVGGTEPEREGLKEIIEAGESTSTLF